MHHYQKLHIKANAYLKSFTWLKYTKVSNKYHRPLGFFPSKLQCWILEWCFWCTLYHVMLVLILHCTLIAMPVIVLQLYRFPLYTCDGYSTCEACVMSRDPAGCGWCGDHCSLHTECLNPPTSGYGQRVQWQNDTCPPVISQVSFVTWC